MIWLTNEFLLHLARDPRFQWSFGLEPLRRSLLAKMPTAGCGGCGSRTTEVQLPVETYEFVRNSPALASELSAIGRQLGEEVRLPPT